MQIIGVRFRRAGKLYEYTDNGLELAKNKRVIVDTPWGVDIGTVAYIREANEADAEKKDWKKIIRIATAEDLEKDGRNRQKEVNAYRICEEKIAKHQLSMKLVAVEYTFDNSKILFYFTAENRVDFRELVKDLASVFHTRIELRQIGVRDETKILGGIGVCGRVLCCHSYLKDFQPVSIRMAKEQHLSLNPTKISGMCGRLMCCLNNEQATYEYLNSRLPQVGDKVTLRREGLKGTVQSVNVLRQTVKVLITSDDDDADVRDCEVEELIFHPHARKGKMKLSAEELQEVKELEAMERRDKGGDSGLSQ
jgi:cell fate regulator YaaT (PSP1 superfamily)